MAKDSISEKTLMPISLVVLFLIGMAWAYATFASSKRVDRLEEALLSIDQRLSVIQGATEEMRNMERANR